MRIGIVKEPSVFLYEKDFVSPTDQLFMGWAVGILGEEAEYYRVVTHYGYVGYLKKDGLKMAVRDEIRLRDATGNVWIVTEPFADVLSEPKVQGERILTLEKGSFVERLHVPGKEDCENGFTRIKTAEGEVGYIPEVAMTRRLDSDGYFYSNRQKYFFLLQRGFTEQEFRERVVFFAKSYLKTPYRWAGKSQQGIDCSGLAFMCYLFSGVIIYRDAKIHPGYPVKSISADRMKEGDLLYFPGHIAIYIGEEKYIHATGNRHSFACVVNSLNEDDSHYREDLKKSLYAVGSIF